MAPTQVIHTVDVHAEGEPGRIVMGMHLQVRGQTMGERLEWCSTHLDWLRNLLLHEPRGHPSMCAVLVLPPITKEADVGIVILEQGGFRPMSGSNTMCAVTALLETGALPITGTETVVRIDTAAGLVEAVATVEGDKVRSVRVRNVPSFVVKLDTPIDVLHYGQIKADIAFGGQFYVQAPAAAMGVELGASNARNIVRAGAALLASAREQVHVTHPENPEINGISLVMLHGPAVTPGTSGRNSVILPNGILDPRDPDTWRGALDRSPCGTGTSARLACLHARGELAVGEAYVHEGVLKTTFRGVIEEEILVAGSPGIIPSIEGRAWISGLNQHVLHATDPFPEGYVVPDIWG